MNWARFDRYRCFVRFMFFFFQLFFFSLGLVFFTSDGVHAQVPKNLSQTMNQLGNELTRASANSDSASPLIVVLDIRNDATGVRDLLSEKSEALLIEIVNQKKGYSAVAYSQIQTVRQEWMEVFPDSSLDQIRKNLADLLGADWVVVGSYRTTNAIIEFRLQLYDALTGHVIWRGQTELLPEKSEPNKPAEIQNSTVTDSIFAETFLSKPSSIDASESLKKREVSEKSEAVLDLFISNGNRFPERERMVFLAEGSFLMGSVQGENNENPPHPVYLDSYYLDKYEVTNAEYAKCPTCERGHGGFDTSEPDQPVVYVDWENANKYCQFVEKRLPTEAEWENAARAGSERKYAWGDDAEQLDEYAWYKKNAGQAGAISAHRVGLKRSNAWGLYDLYGNVMEWTSNWYTADYYQKLESNNPIGPGEPLDTEYPLRSVRGGGWGGVFGGGEA